jgi:hypothetical protein
MRHKKAECFQKGREDDDDSNDLIELGCEGLNAF